MWSDTLLAAERSHLVRLLVWAVTSAMLGTVFVTVLTVRRLSAPIVFWFAVQTLTWGTLELVIMAVRWQALGMRDVRGADRLGRLTWFVIGVDVGLVAIGVSSAIMAWRASRNLGAFGGGLGVLVQGLGLLVLDLTFASILARLV